MAKHKHSSLLEAAVNQLSRIRSHQPPLGVLIHVDSILAILYSTQNVYPNVVDSQAPVEARCSYELEYTVSSLEESTFRCYLSLRSARPRPLRTTCPPFS